jgi:NAD(P)-dependent dehydrogenase (short-subunit alcohol dehydrogenase family)
VNIRTVLLTGAAGSLGSALAYECARAGLSVVMLDCNQRGLERQYDRIVEQGHAEPTLFPIDLAAAGPQEFEQMVDAISAEFGGLDALVHCAARFEHLTPVEHVQPEEWLLTMQVNLNAAWLLSSLCLPLLRSADAGRLYFMLEDLEVVAGPLWGAYGVSKHALQTLVGQLEPSCRSSGVQLLGINPGPMQSSLRSRAYHGEHPQAQPPPETAAAQIMQLLLGKLLPSGLFVDLAGIRAAH